MKRSISAQREAFASDSETVKGNFAIRLLRNLIAFPMLIENGRHSIKKETKLLIFAVKSLVRDFSGGVE
jgi:hypothetical protein